MNPILPPQFLMSLTTLRRFCISFIQGLIAFTLFICSLNAANHTWTANGDGDWDTGGNWAGGVPGQTDKAYLLNDPVIGGSDITISLDSNETIGEIHMSSTYNYTITGAYQLRLDDAHGSNINPYGAVSGNTGTHTLSVSDFLLINPADFVNNSTSSSNVFTVTSDMETRGNRVYFSGSAQVVFSGNITDNNTDTSSNTINTVNHIGSGKVTLSGDNEHRSDTILSGGGIMEIQHLDALGDRGAGSTTNTTISSGSQLNINIAAGGVLDNEDIYITGTGVSNGGALSLDANSGDVEISGDVILVVDSSIHVADANDTLTLSGNLYDVGDKKLIKTGDGTLELTYDNGWDEGVDIDGGTVKISADLKLGNTPSTGHVTMNGGTLQTTATFTLDSDRNVVLEAGGGTVNTDSGTTLTYGGVISGAGALNKSGTGTFVSTGANTWSGGTNVNTGTLTLSTGSSSGAAALNVQGGTMNINNGYEYAQTSGNVVVGNASGNGIMNIDGSGSTATLSGGDIIIADTSGSVGAMTVSNGADLVQTNGLIFVGEGGTGSLTVNGSGSTVTLSGAGNDIRVGDDNGSSGYLEVSAGGQLIANASDVDLRIGQSSGSLGSALITGSGTTVQIGTDVWIGVSSGEDNQLTVSDGAYLDIGDDFQMGNTATANGSAIVSGGSTVNVGDNMIFGTSGTGKLTVSGANTDMNITDNIQLGLVAGSYGALTVSSGADLSSGATTTIGVNGTGVMAVTGTNSKFSGAGVLVGANTSGIGTLTVSSGGKFNGTDMIVKNSGSSVSAVNIDVGTSGNTADYLSLSGKLVVSDTSSASASANLYIANATGESGQVTVISGGNLSVTGDTYIGDDGAAVMTVTGSGSSHTSATGDIYVGNNSGSNGLLTLSSGALLTNTGASSDLFIGHDSGSVGTVDISGAGTSALLGTVYVGEGSAANNELDIADTATVSTNGGIIIANVSSAKGTVSVRSGSELTVGGNMNVGDDGTGVLSISASTVTNGNNDILIGNNSGSNGLLELSSAAVLSNTGTSSDLHLGVSTGSVGSMNVSGNGTTAILNNLVVGDASAADNRLLVSDSATITTNGYIDVGRDANSNGSITITSGADVTSSGSVGVGTSGTGLLTVNGSGSTLTVNDDMFVGHNAGANGTVTVVGGAELTTNRFYSGHTSSGVVSITGSGSKLNVVGGGTGSLVVGLSSNGYLGLESGAVLTATVVGTDFLIGHNAGGTGSVKISGEGTSALISDTVFVGNNSGADNRLHISNSAVLNTSNHFVIGNGSSGNGNVTIESGGDLIASNDIYVAQTGTASLTVKDSGSTINTANLILGNNASSNGVITIESGSEVNVSSSSWVGKDGTGSLTVTGTNSKLTVGSNLRIGNDGILTIASGGKVSVTNTIYVGAVTGTGGTLNLNTSDGIIDGADMELRGGTFNTGGNDQTAGGLGDLTMTANSIIDMGGSDSVINWSVIDENTWNGTLIIHNWTGTRNQTGGTDQLIFSDITNFNKGAQVWFYSGSGTGKIAEYGVLKSIGPGKWELVPAPEPGTWIGGGLLLLIGVWRERRRLKSIAQRRQDAE